MTWLEQRVLARELEVSQKRLNLAADSANLGMWEWDIVT